MEMLRSTVARKPDLGKWWTQKHLQVEAAAEKVVEQASQVGADAMRQNIATRGTNNGPWDPGWDRMAHGTPGRGETGSTPGRDASGTMIDAVRSRFSSGGKAKDHVSTAAFGLILPSEQETYFKAQDQGFRHNFTGATVPGMYALSDAAAEAWQWLQDNLDKEIESA